MAVDLNKLQAVFLEVVEIQDAAERAAALERACRGDADLRQRVDSLLVAHESPESLLDGPLIRHGDATSVFVPEAAAGALIAGRYKLLEQIGEGGMGLVWMAEQRAPVRRLVAIKLIKAGMDSRAVLARFEAERQALAMMDHPSIARVFDGGVTEHGHPWFAMELVRGLAVTDYCDQRRMPIAERLALFMQICSAVQHAHQKGIIHRDLKPSNVLVTEHDGRPLPKIIDFGLAKALGGGAVLTEHTLVTSFGTAAGTPLYMAPEQVAINALDVDTRADVYALGVLLYELLTGSTPLERQRVKDAAWDELRRAIREEEPLRPSMRISSSAALPNLAATRQIEPAKLSGLVRGDLDWIVLKALEKDRNRRYESASGLSADIGRHLANEPVVAAPPTLGYRARKYVAKHRGPVIAATAVAAALVLGIIGTSVMTLRYRSASADAIARADSEAKARNAAELDSYIANIAAAQSAFAAGSYPEARQRLDACPESRRGWEWKHLRQKAGNTVFTVPSRYYVERFSPDSSRIILTTEDGIVDVWDLAGRPVTKPIKVGISEWAQAQLNADGTRLLAASADGIIGLWDLKGEPLVEPLRTGQSWGYYYGRIVSPDGARVLTRHKTSEATSAILYETTQDFKITQVDLSERLYGDPSDTFAWCSDGKRFITRSINTTEKLWDVTGRPPGAPISPIRTLKKKDGPNAVTRMFGPDGKLVGEPLAGGWAWFSPSGTHVLTRTKDSVRIWDLDGQPVGKPIPCLSQGDGVNFTPNGNLVVGSQNLRFWDLAGNPKGVVFKPPGDSGGRTISPDGSRVISEGSQITLLTNTGLTIGTRQYGKQSIGRVQFSPDGRYAFIAFEDHDGYPTAPTLIVLTAEFDDATEMVSIYDSVDKAEQQWLVEVARSARRNPAGTSETNPSRISVRPAVDGGIDVVNEAGEIVQRLAAHPGPIAATAVSYNCRRVVSSGQYDHAVRFWDTASWREVAAIHLDGGVKTLEFTPDDTRLIVTRLDGTVEIWDTRPIAERRRDYETRWAKRQAARPSGDRYVDNLLMRPLSDDAEDLEELIANDDSLSPLERVAALDALADRVDGIRRNAEAAWDIVCTPNHTPQEYAKALDNARMAMLIEMPATQFNVQFIRTLGAAQYRVGQFQEAIATLSRYRPYGQEYVYPKYQETSMILKAMAMYQLGDHISARETLAEVDQLLHSKEGSLQKIVHEEALLFEEAKSLIGRTLSADEAENDPASQPDLPNGKQ